MAELEVKLYQLGDLGTNCYIVSNQETKEESWLIRRIMQILFIRV